MPLATGTPFKLSARADRIDVLQSGDARLIDYKSGAPPTAKEVKAGFSPQLTLGSGDAAAGRVRGAAARSKPRRRFISSLAARRAAKKNTPAERARTSVALAEQHFAGLQMLLDAFACEETPYLSRPFPKFAPRFSDYDHLARVKEWSATGGESDSGDAP